MKQRYLEVTFRGGRPLAAYLYLPRAGGARAARTVDEGHGLRVDIDEHGAVMGVEVTAPSAVSIAQVNSVLSRYGVEALDAQDWSPLAA